jgi:transitional endoplasmic reticulum ATPase
MRRSGLWDDPVASPAAPVFGLSDRIAAVRSGAPAVVAAVGDDLIGTAVASVSGARATLMLKLPAENAA